MTLSRKMILKTIALVMGLGLLGATSLWGLYGLRAAVHSAREEYRELRMIREVDRHLAAVVGLLSAHEADRRDVVAELEMAIGRLDSFLMMQGHQKDQTLPHQLHERTSAAAAMQSLLHVQEQLDAQRASRIGGRFAASATAILREADNELSQLAAEMDQTIGHAQEDATLKLRVATILMVALTVGIVAAAIVINISQFRSVMHPLERLRRGVRRIASGSFDERIPIAGDREFADLAHDFNEMAGQLDDLYRDLEGRVRVQSKELIRSERLASVGFLAAGVAHEINNPLNIISGHAELFLKRLQQSPPQDYYVRDMVKNIEIVRDEAFRCKEIIQKLLLLARGDLDDRETVSLRSVVDDVVDMVRGLKQYRGRSVAVDIDRSADYRVIASAAELKQVLLNLTVNALEAVDSGRGEVRIEGQQRNGWVELCVRDNGRGMTPETLEKVFEPFFTTRRGSTGRGVGLGLSISHAIIKSHGGRIVAQSDGMNRGSRFTVHLPAAGGTRRE